MLRPARAPLFAIALSVLAGCTSGLDERNFSRLRVGMTAQEVEAVLGKGGKEMSPDDVSALMREALAAKEGPTGGPKLDLTGTRGIRWGDDSKWITVIYTGDRVSRLFRKGF